MLGYNFVKSNIGHDGIGYMCFDLEPEKLDEHDLIRVVEMSKIWFIACAGATQGFGDKDSYGKTWLAYRSKPKGREE